MTENQLHMYPMGKSAERWFSLASNRMPTCGVVTIDNIGFYSVDMEGAVDKIREMAEQTDRPRMVCTANLDHMAMLQNDSEFRAIYNTADLVLADGMPVVWLSRLSEGGPLPARVTGSDLFWELARVSAETGLRLFYLGGAPGSAERAAEEVQKRYPGAQVCGIYCPSFEEFDSPEEQARIAAAISEARPHILLVGLGAPKQEKWIAAQKDHLGIPVSIGVGGSFEMAGGLVRRAPRRMQQFGLEWTWRLCQEPSRLWRRYLLRDLPVLLRLTRRAILARKGTPERVTDVSAQPDRVSHPGCTVSPPVVVPGRCDRSDCCHGAGVDAARQDLHR